MKESLKNVGRQEVLLGCSKSRAARRGAHDARRIYGWFTGFDTADLKDAKALLDELNA